MQAIKDATTDSTVAVMIEPVQGEGGVNIPSVDYLKGVREWCDQNNMLLIFDEVQTGLGRLGTLFGYQSFGVEPDIITLAKGLGGGVPIGAFMAKDSACAFDPGDHGSTFGGNPLTCAAAHASTKYILENDVVNNAAKMGEYLSAGLRKLQSDNEFFTDVRGMGLLWAVEFDSDIIKFDQILNVFWQAHDPTTLNRQGNDVGTQYRSVIFYHNEQQKEKAEMSKKNAEKSGYWPNPIVTEITQLNNYSDAEDYHHNYYNDNPNQPYCIFVIKPKLDKLEKDCVIED